MEEITNRVANSGLISFDLEDYYDQSERIVFDIKNQLYEGLVLREKDFRAFIKEHDWSAYQDKNVTITCTAEAIVPTWAYMLITTRLEPYAKNVLFGSLEAMETYLFNKAIASINPEDYRDAKLVIKGCSNHPVPISAYTELVRRLAPVVTSIMYGEPCSTVPIYKRKK